MNMGMKVGSKNKTSRNPDGYSNDPEVATPA